MKDEIERFLASGGHIERLDITERANPHPNREFSIVSQGQRERKQHKESLAIHQVRR